MITVTGVQPNDYDILITAPAGGFSVTDSQVTSPGIFNNIVGVGWGHPVEEGLGAVKFYTGATE